MDSWTEKQLDVMKAGGNDKCNNFLKERGVDPRTPIKAKYESPAAQLYKEVMKARLEGRPEPTQLPTPAAPANRPPMGGSVGKPGEDPNGMERLAGETDDQYIARQTRLREEARARMAAKFGNSNRMGGVGSNGGGGGGRMAGIGSDPSYNPNGGHGVDVDSLVSGLGSAFGAIGSIARSATHNISSIVQDEKTYSSVKSTGASLWGSLSAAAQNLTKPEGDDGLAELHRQMQSNRSATGSKYSGFGSDSMFKNTSSNSNSFSQPAPSSGSALVECPGMPGEDRNGIERLTGESDEQYIARQTRIRDEAKARMAAKFGKSGLSSASSSAYTPASNGQSAPRSGSFAGNSMPQQQQHVGVRSAPSSGNFAMPKASTPPRPAVNSNDFFSNFGA
jgi:ADP-ribosylation factor GTPase-activating protein 1